MTAGAVAVALVAALLTAVLASPDASAATVMTFKPVADTYVQNTAPASNYGTAGRVLVEGSPVRRTFIKFTVSGLSGNVTGATLKLHVDNVDTAGGPDGGTVSTSTNNSWSETGTTWNNQPAIDGSALGSFGSVTYNRWYTRNVAPAVTGNGTYTFAITSSNGDGVSYDSRETGSTSPVLVVTTDAVEPVVYAAGDIAYCWSSGDEKTAAILQANPDGTVLALGDTVYDVGSAEEYADCYEPTWGVAKARTRPAPGNHEYRTSGASGYFGYYGLAAGDPLRGYYSFDLGNWHLVSLNSNCSVVSCAAGSVQEQWLRADLAASSARCTLAYWHHPRFSSGTVHGSNVEVAPLYKALYDFNADLVLAGHEHSYERFAPMNPSGQVDSVRGIRNIVVGTGGRSHTYFSSTVHVGSQIRKGSAYGVLKLVLHASSYDWQFLPEAGQTWTDKGTQSCH